MEAERLGQQLQEARESRELTLEQVEQALRIRARYLAAFESGQYDDLPGAVQARGFLRNYARFLALDDDAVLARFDAIQAARPSRSSPATRTRPQTAVTAPVPVPPPAEDSYGTASQARPRRGWRGVIVVLLAGVVVLLCGGVILAVQEVLNRDASRQRAGLLAVLPTVPTLTSSATFVPSPTPPPGSRGQVGAALITDRVVLDVQVTERTFMRVLADGILIFEGVVRPGTALQYQAQQSLTLQAGSGAALDVVFNNLPLGLLGARGEAVDTTFTPDLVLTPTPDQAPVPTFTPPGADAPAFFEELGQGESPDAAGQETVLAPTPLPLPGQAADVVGSTPMISAPVATETLAVPASATPTVTATPSLTLTPSPTPVLPPRWTSTPAASR